MPFRSELEATRARIKALEERVRELEAPAGERRRRIAAAVFPAICVALLAAMTFGLAMKDMDAPAWILANVTAVVGIFGTLWSWGLTGRAWAPWLFLLAKAALPVVMGWGWWSLSYDEVHQPVFVRRSFDFFWYVPSLMVAIAVIEALLIARSSK